MIEHALCPLDTRTSLKRGLIHETTFNYTDDNRNRKKGKVQIGCVDGLSPSDELYLWGILGLALAGKDPSNEFYATPYWILRQLGRIKTTKKGSKEFKLFRESIRRLAGVRYHNTAFYDPIRGEHREVSFGLMSFSLPLKSDSARAWRFAFDPIFWELISANRSSLKFDMQLYADLSPAGRRLYLYLKKQFWRNTVTGSMSVRDTAVSVLGLTGQLPLKRLRQKLERAVEELIQVELVGYGLGNDSFDDCVTKIGVGEYRFQLHRGPAMERVSELGTNRPEDSPLYESLLTIGFDRTAVVRLLASHKTSLLQQWIDITLAAMERGVIDKSPPAYFTYYVQNKMTPPDWWHELKRQERQQEADQQRATRAFNIKFSEERGFEEYIRSEARDAFDQVMSSLVSDLMRGGKPKHEAEQFAREQTMHHFRGRYRREKNPSFERL